MRDLRRRGAARTNSPAPRRRQRVNGSDILTLITIFVLSAFVGFEVISKVPSILHTPLMSGTNAIHGVVL
ncbi:MAG TPA: proton-translocating transhydrogenase family protein, partial [Acidimicrobiales bacterium]|nr:proton-translocating transhydrogenase family protein [Acidimicrobiales bacterium]